MNLNLLLDTLVKAYENEDHEKLALLHILTNNEYLSSHFDEIFDLKTGCIKPDCLDKPWCSASLALVRLAFNLYNGWTDSTYKWDLDGLITPLDFNNRRIALEAISIRYRL